MSVKLSSFVWDGCASTGMKISKVAIMARLADFSSDEGICWPSVETIARQIGAGVSTVRTALSELEKEGWISKQQRRNGNRNASNIYQLNVEKLRASAQPPESERSKSDASKSDPSKSEPSESKDKSTFHPPESGGDPSVNSKHDPSSNRSSCPVAEQPDGLPDDDAFLTSHPEAAVFSAKKRQWGSHEDLTCAKWIWGRIVKLYEQAAEYDGELVRPKEPNWVLWSNEIRLMCAQDGRTHRQICELFDRANRDSFWCKNILSPAKLREKWDDLSLKLSINPLHAEAVAGGHWNSEEGWRDVL